MHRYRHLLRWLLRSLPHLPKGLRLASIQLGESSGRIYDNVLRRMIAAGASQLGSVGLGQGASLHVLALGGRYYVYLTKEEVLDDDWPTFRTGEVIADRAEFDVLPTEDFQGFGTCFAGTDLPGRTSYFGVFTKDSTAELGPAPCRRMWKASRTHLRIVRVSRREAHLDRKWQAPPSEVATTKAKPWYMA